MHEPSGRLYFTSLTGRGHQYRSRATTVILLTKPPDADTRTNFLPTRDEQHAIFFLLELHKHYAQLDLSPCMHACTCSVLFVVSGDFSHLVHSHRLTFPIKQTSANLLLDIASCFNTCNTTYPTANPCSIWSHCHS